ncbi:sucrase ferredoxin [Almyronema epifaneia]|uniref:Sucrase ferredoxin n=1 Tax=Almyronema epifaneia S1 TaxID=2991925 RepID=A0ABW6IFS8_9CYAN
MSVPSLTSDCQFCSVVSKINGEDPIGSANFCLGWLVMELPLPWTKERFDTDPLLQPIYQLLHTLFNQGIQVMPLAIAPDRSYSTPGRSRVVYYQQPAAAFAQFEPQEFLLPSEQIINLVKALLLDPAELPHFDAYRRPVQAQRELMVCTHGNIDVACARFGQPVYQQLRRSYASIKDPGIAEGAGVNRDSLPMSASMRSAAPLRVWRCSHFGGHQFAPTLIDFPLGQVWGHLELEILDALVRRDRPVTELRPFYRGWSALGKFEQIVEREIWMERGWEWLTFHKSGQVLAQDGNHKTPHWAKVRIHFKSPEGQIQGSYEASVEAKGEVMTAHYSGGAPVPALQYQVSGLKQQD